MTGTTQASPALVSQAGCVYAGAAAGSDGGPGGGSGKPVTFSPGSPPVCSVSGGTVTSNTAGSCVVDANQAVSAQYQAPAHCSGRTERHGPVSPTRHRPSGAGTGCPIGSKGESIRDPDVTSACQSPNSSASGRGTGDQPDEDSSCVRQTGQMARTTTPPKPPRYGTSPPDREAEIL